MKKHIPNNNAIFGTQNKNYSISKTSQIRMVILRLYFQTTLYNHYKHAQVYFSVTVFYTHVHARTYESLNHFNITFEISGELVSHYLLLGHLLLLFTTIYLKQLISIEMNRVEISPT